jgi:hypothetical protein
MAEGRVDSHAFVAGLGLDAPRGGDLGTIGN